MAINPELITTIRVDQLPDETLSLTNLFPHTVGTDLKSATIQELVDLVATAIGVSGGVGYIAISVTDGQQLPDVPELPSFFLCGAGTFLNINGYPNIICTENLNAIMSLTDHWELAVEIPINPLSGTVQSVTGSAVDNTDPLNPVINEIIYGVQNIVAGTNINVDNTDPANPIVSATGGGGSQTLAEVLVEGNITDGNDISISDGDKIVLDNGANLKKGTTDAGLGGTKGIALRCAVDYELKWEAGRLYVMGGDGFTIREVSHNFTTTPTVTDDDTKGFVLDSRWILDNGDVYLCTDDTTGAAVWELVNTGTTPTLQEVTDAGNETTTSIKVKDNEKSVTLQTNGINYQDIDDGGSTILRFENTSVVDQEVFIRGLGGTIALTSDITTPTLQEVLDEGDSAIDSAIFLSNTANDFETSVNEFGDGQINLKSVVNDTLTTIGAGQVYLGTVDGSDNAIINKDGINVNAVNYAFPSGASSPLATLADIPTGGSGIPHATASGTDTYTATITGVAAYTDADAFLIRFTNGNTTGATLNINSLGAKTLYRNNDGALIGGDIINGGEMLCIYNTSLNGFQVIGTAPNSLFAYVTNDDSVTITKGMPVYAFSGTGDRMTVKRANNSTDATSAQTVGLVLSTSIAANQKGLIMMQGLLDGLSILPTSTWADGDPVYLGATAGTITNVKPYAPNHLVYLGVVTTASNGSAGRMYVRVQNGYELSEIHDIDLITNAPTNNQVLTYESSTDLWKNKSLGTILGYTPYRNVQTSQTAITGTTAETIAFTATIPAGAFNSVDVLKVLFGANKTTGLAAYTLRLRVNTTNTISGAPTIATYTGSASSQVNVIMRNFNLNGGNLYGLAGSASSLTDIVVSGSALGSNTLNPANTFYLFATVQLGNSGDSIIGNMFTIHN